MTQDDVSKWRTWYGDKENMKNHIDDVLRQRGESLFDSQERFSDTHATIALLKDEESNLTEQYGKLYRWIWQYNKVMGAHVEASFVATYIRHVQTDIDAEKSCALPDGWRLMLQLFVKDRWWDWIYLQKSDQMVSHLGVFAARDFPKGSIIGYLCGPCVHRCDVPGACRPTLDSLPNKSLEDEDYLISFRNGMACWEYIAPKPITTEPGSGLYLGMHHINDACSSFKIGSKKYDSAKKYKNCALLEDGSVCAIKKIPPNAEILRSGGWNCDVQMMGIEDFLGENNGGRYNKEDQCNRHKRARTREKT
jgi:hypothetical protein